MTEYAVGDGQQVQLELDFAGELFGRLSPDDLNSLKENAASLEKAEIAPQFRTFVKHNDLPTTLL